MIRDDPPWLRQCLEAISHVPGGKLCPSDLCASQGMSELMNSICECQPPYENGCYPSPTPGCCGFGAGTPVGPFGVSGDPDIQRCYCCCGGTATWPDLCEAEVDVLGGELCESPVCSTGDAQAYMRAYCTCTSPYEGACQSSLSGSGSCDCAQASPAFLNGSNCYCCCGTVLASTFTAVDRVRGKSAEEFVVGDPIYVAEDASLTRWTQRPVAFSAGASATGLRAPVVRVRFRVGDTVDWVVADRNRPFLLDGGALRRAGDLSSGDALVRGDGAPAPVVEVAPVAPRIVHQLATGREPARHAAGHLLLVHGVVAGDYALQLADLDALGPAAAKA